MTTGLKIILIIAAFIIFGFLTGLIIAATGSTHGGGPIMLILGFAFLAGVRAIWKYKPEINSKNTKLQKKDIEDKHILDKE